MTQSIDELSEEQLQHMIDHSFANFHAKGLDYLCLKRTPNLTEKIYFFEGDVSRLPDVVNPHDHRYNFKTTVLTGAMSDSSYKITTDKHLRPPFHDNPPFYEHEWHTPLNGGSGAKYKRKVYLVEDYRARLYAGGSLATYHQTIHTIRMHTDTCVIKLEQYDDVLPVDQPTRLYMRDRAPLDLNGLYEKPSADHCRKRYGQYLELMRKLEG